MIEYNKTYFLDELNEGLEGLGRKLTKMAVDKENELKEKGINLESILSDKDIKELEYLKKRFAYQAELAKPVAGGSVELSVEDPILVNYRNKLEGLMQSAPTVKEAKEAFIELCKLIPKK